LQTLDKSALLPWAVNETISAIRSRISPGQTYSDAILEDIWEWAKDARFRTSDLAAQHGTRAHEIIEQFLHNRTMPDTTQEAPEVQNAVILWREWWDAQDLEVCDIERYVAHLGLGYGGTVDFLARTNDGRVVLIDWKTSKGIYPEYLLQCVAYGGALSAMGLGMPAAAHIVRIGKTDATVEVQTAWNNLAEARELWQLWAAVCRLHHGLKAMDGRCKKARREWDKRQPVAPPSLTPEQIKDAFTFF